MTVFLLDSGVPVDLFFGGATLELACPMHQLNVLRTWPGRKSRAMVDASLEHRADQSSSMPKLRAAARSGGRNIRSISGIATRPA